AIFLYVYIEISIFIQVAHVLGVLLTLVLVICTSVIGMSLVRNQGFKNFVLMQQKMAAGENPAAEMIKSVVQLFGVGALWIACVIGYLACFASL
ncbi:FxsA family protein, partial [Escherichia sp. R-CC3]